MLTYVLAATLLMQSPASAQSAPASQATTENSIVGKSNAPAWGNAEVADYLWTFGPDKVVAEDPFASPTSPVPPKNVVLSFPIPPRANSLLTYWTYDRDAQTMTIVAGENDNAASGSARVNEIPVGTNPAMRGWALTARRGPPRLAFSGRREVQVRTRHVTGFGQVQTYATPGQRPDARVFQYTFSIEPEAARALSGELELRVFGKARPWRGEQRTFCVTDYSALSSGIEVRPCFLTGDLETYQVIDKRDGSVIHEWDAR